MDRDSGNAASSGDDSAEGSGGVGRRWLRRTLYLVAALCIGWAGVVSLAIGACDPHFDGPWCGGDAGRILEGYVAGTVMTTLGFGLLGRAFTRRWSGAVLAAAAGLALSLLFVAKVEALL